MGPWRPPARSEAITPIEAEAYFLKAPAAPLTRGALPLSRPAAGQALVEVLACGLCHTDLAFADGSVAPRHALPLVLGHEIAGRVVEAGEGCGHLVGKPVLVPAVLPCGDCPFCAAGRGNACPRQQMPGNDIHGGFGTHVLVPAAHLVPLDGAPAGFPLADLAAVADAAGTAYQAVRRSGLGGGDLAVVVGAGGVGGFLCQVAAALGARVVACDVSAERLAAVGEHGAAAVVDVAARDPRKVRSEVQRLAREWGIPSLRHRLFEASGTAAGQELAWGLLAPGSTLVQVGFTRDKVALRLANLMAFDATAHGTWGCPPEAFPEVLALIYAGRVVIGPFVEHAPLGDLNRLLDDMAHHRLSRRMILHPEPC